MRGRRLYCIAVCTPVRTHQVQTAVVSKCLARNAGARRSDLDELSKATPAACVSKAAFAEAFAAFAAAFAAAAAQQHSTSVPGTVTGPHQAVRGFSALKRNFVVNFYTETLGGTLGYICGRCKWDTSQACIA